MTTTPLPKRASAPEIRALAADKRPRVYARRFFPTFLRVARALAPEVSQARHVTIARALVAHTAHETGWGVGLYWWGFGNIVAGKSERRYSHRDWHPDGSGGANEYAVTFRAYRSELEGAIDYATFVKRRTSSAWRAIASGDAGTFYSRLRAHGYFPGAVKNEDGSVTLLTDGQLDGSFRSTVRLVERETADLVPTSSGRALRLGSGVLVAGVGALAAFDLLPSPSTLSELLP